MIYTMFQVKHTKDSVSLRNAVSYIKNMDTESEEFSKYCLSVEQKCKTTMDGMIPIGELEKCIEGHSIEISSLRIFLETMDMDRVMGGVNLSNRNSRVMLAALFTVQENLTRHVESMEGVYGKAIEDRMKLLCFLIEDMYITYTNGSQLIIIEGEKDDRVKLYDPSKVLPKVISDYNENQKYIMVGEDIKRVVRNKIGLDHMKYLTKKYGKEFLPFKSYDKYVGEEVCLFFYSTLLFIKYIANTGGKQRLIKGGINEQFHKQSQLMYELFDDIEAFFVNEIFTVLN